MVVPQTDDAAIARLCRQAWDLNHVEVVDRPVSDGGSAALYRIRSGNDVFLLKEHLGAYAADDVEQGARTVAYLTARGFPTPAFRPTRHGAMTAPAGGRLYSLRTWVEGRVLARQEITAAHAARLGAVLGWCHRTLAAMPAEPLVEWWSDTTQAVQESGPIRVVQELDHLAARIRARPERFATDEIVLEAIAFRRNLLQGAGDLTSLYAPCPVQVVHGDFHRGNVLWRPDGGLAGVIDIEGYTQHRVREVYRAIVFLQHRVHPAAVDVQLARTFVRGYQQEAPLTPEELRRGPALLRWRLLRGMTDFRTYIGNPHDADTMARMGWAQDLIRWLAEHGHELGEELARATKP